MNGLYTVGSLLLLKQTADWYLHFVANCLFCVSVYIWRVHVAVAMIVGCLSDWHGWCRKCTGSTWFAGC